MTWIIEATLDTNQHLQSEIHDEVWTSELELHDREDIRALRTMTMVESVAVINTETGEVLINLPSRVVLARCKQQTAMLQIPLL